VPPAPRKLLEVNPPSPDQAIGIVDSSAAASRLVGEWLDSVGTDATAAGNEQQQSVAGDR
jgi:hypothetical protein